MTGDATPAIIERAREAGVIGMIVPATSLDDAAAAVDIADGRAIWAAVGFHPHEASRFDESAAVALAGLVQREGVVAVGEIGLDYHYDHSPRDQQREVFLRQIAIARAAGKPIIVHNRESTDDLLSLLTSAEASGVRGVLHSFTESVVVARRLIDLGFFISFSGILTFRTAEALREVARVLPHDRVLIETDSPYLAPVPYRGKQNEPSFVTAIANQLATLWKSGIDYVAEQTTRNFEQAFGVRIVGEPVERSS